MRLIDGESWRGTVWTEGHDALTSRPNRLELEQDLLVLERLQLGLLLDVAQLVLEQLDRVHLLLFHRVVQLFKHRNENKILSIQS